MASLQRSRSGLYFVAFRFSGTRFYRSLETCDEMDARQQKTLIERTLKHINEGVVQLPANATPQRLWHFVRTGGRQVEVSQLLSSTTLSSICERYLESFDDSTKEPSTCDTERYHLNHFQRILGKTTPFETIDAASLRQYVASRRDEKGIRGSYVRPTTISKELQTYRQLWEFAAGDGWVSGSNPVSQIRRPRRNEKPPFMTWEQIQATVQRGGLTDIEIKELYDCLFLRENEVGEFLQAVQSESIGLDRFPYVYPALAFCAYTGARRSEMFRCQIDDVNTSVLIREKKRSKDRRITFRSVPLHPALGEILDDWLKAHPGGQSMFCKSNGNPLEDKTSREAFRAVTKRTRWRVLRGYHIFRHSFASNLARRGVDARVIDELMGHQTEEMRRRYRHLFPEDAVSAVSVLNFGH